MLLQQDLAAGSPAFSLPYSPLHYAVLQQNMPAMSIILRHSRNNYPKLGDKDNLLVNRNVKALTLDPKDVIWYPALYGQPAPNRRVSGTALYMATYMGLLTFVDYLLEDDADPNIHDESGETPLQIAVRRTDESMVELLLEYGANPNIVDNNGITPLIEAAGAGNIDILCILADVGAKFHPADDLGQNAFHHAALGGHVDAFLYFLDKGMDPYQASHSGATVIEMALSNQETSPQLSAAHLQTLVLHYGFDFDRCPGIVSTTIFGRDLGTKVLKWLLKRLPREYVQREINKGTNPRIKGTPLCQAARVGRLGSVRVLLEMGADIDLDFDNQGTPLLAACAWGRLDTVKFLVRAGAGIWGTMGGEESNAVRAAGWNRDVVEWLLVGRWVERRMIEDGSEETEGSGGQSTREVKCWSGVRGAEVRIRGVYVPEHGISSIQRAEELERVRRGLRGEVGMVEKLL